MKNKKISVVFPAYNEEKRIEKTLKKTIKYLKNNFKDYEIIIVDDCSTDNTNKIISKYKTKKIIILKNKKNEGKGYSVKKGMLKAKHPLILFSDSDLATPIEELKKFIKLSEKFDIVIASRNLKDSDVRTKQPIFRQALGKIFPLLVNIIILKDFKDTQCGFKLFKKKASKKIFTLQTFNKFSFDVEILLIAKKAGYKIKEAPVIWIDKKYSKVSPLKDGIKMLIDLLKIKYKNIKGLYKSNNYKIHKITRGG